MQHLHEFCHSAKSLAVHLTGMCSGFKYYRNPDICQALQHSLNGKVELDHPEPPKFKGEITIMAILTAEGLETHIQAVYNWVESTGRAWTLHDDLAHE